MNRIFDLWATAGIEPTGTHRGSTPFYTVAASPTQEVIEDKRSGHLWLIDYSSAPEVVDGEENAYNAPIRRAVDRDVYRVQNGEMAMIQMERSE